jgi:lysophospholipase L1-like esterase
MPDQHSNAGAAALPRRVVFFGDSRADWWQVPVISSFQCIAVGVPGASAAYLARRFPAMVAPLRPDIVVVQMGVNDLTGLMARASDRDQVLATTCAAITAVVAGAQALDAQVVLTTIFPLARGPQTARAVQEAIAVANQSLLALAAPGVQVFDSAAVLAGADGYVRPAYAEDELHLSPAGYAALNEALAPLLTAEGTL